MGTRTVRLDLVLNVQMMAHSLVLVTAVCNDRHTAQSTENSCFIKIKNKAVILCKHTVGMYTVECKKVWKQKDATALEKDISVRQA